MLPESRPSPYHWPMANRSVQRGRRLLAASVLCVLPLAAAACSSGGSSSSTPTTLNTSCKDLNHANKALGQAVHVTTATPESLTSAVKQFSKELKRVQGGLPPSTASSVKALKHQLVVTRIHLAGTQPTEFGDDLYAARQELKVIRKACKAAR